MLQPTKSDSSERSCQPTLSLGIDKDEPTGEWTLCRAVETYETDCVGDEVRFKVAGDWIESPPHHPIWVVDVEDLADRPRPDHVKSAETVGAIVPGRWVDAGDLRVGDELLLQPDRRATIDAIEFQDVVAKVYNFQVEQLHNYAVGFECELVHNNACDAAGDAARSLVRFGNNANRNAHAFRHVIDAGLDQGTVQAAILTDLAANAAAINAGLNIRTITVAGRQITYNAFRFADGLINVGRITVP